MSSDDTSSASFSTPRGRPGSRAIVLRFGPWLYVPVGLLAVALLVTAGWFYRYSVSSRFCSSCHVMEPFVTGWENSGHRDVECVDCHYETGFRNQFQGRLAALARLILYWSGNYNTNSYVVINDASCLVGGCHLLLDLLERPSFYLGEEIFTHRSHLSGPLQGMVLRCTNCHSEAHYETCLGVSSQTCFLCHFRDGIWKDEQGTNEFCLQCHLVPSRSVVAGRHDHETYLRHGARCRHCHEEADGRGGEVSADSCRACHLNHEVLGRLSETDELHERHVTRGKVRCSRCHAPVRHPAPREAKTANSCSGCHGEQHEASAVLYHGTGGRGVPASPSAMSAAGVTCAACHAPEHAGGHRIGPVSDRACHACHGQDYDGTIAEWSTVFEQSLAELAKDLAAAEQALADLPPEAPQRQDLESKLAQARHNHLLVRTGNGLHHIVRSMQLLEQSRQWCRELLAASEAE
jgi:hypothetical protein